MEAVIAMSPEANDDGAGSTPVAEGGEAACWAHLTCEECGAVSGEGHHEGCSSAEARPA